MTRNVTDPVLTPKQRKAVEALLLTGDVSAAAKAAGVSRESLYRWLRQPLFLAAVREAEARAPGCCSCASWRRWRRGWPISSVGRAWSRRSEVNPIA